MLRLLLFAVFFSAGALSEGTTTALPSLGLVLSAAITFPVMVSFIEPWFSLFVPEENVTFTSLLKDPGLPAELYPTEIFPVFPGSMVCLGHSGVVQPHPAWAVTTLIGLFPLLVKLKSKLAFGPSGMLPKLCSTFSNSTVGVQFCSVLAGCAKLAAQVKTVPAMMLSIVFML